MVQPSFKFFLIPGKHLTFFTCKSIHNYLYAFALTMSKIILAGSMNAIFNAAKRKITLALN